METDYYKIKLELFIGQIDNILNQSKKDGWDENKLRLAIDKVKQMHYNTFQDSLNPNRGMIVPQNIH